ncbi:MAG: multidrug DMT transporter permease [Pseudopedobacter saltans]|uniref:Multidrug DMT transporter permease n=1 Tax=Pseudopedobacter saltans TaxID=151895 RepID=A0A2W5EES7_9SPHI|nr:MAG: multidrug DMT transporter permease [Pseudopedobacter saltans]
MFIVNNYFLAVALCFVTMLCWGSWANTQKVTSSTWRYELFYWDYVIGILLLSIVSAFTLGSVGTGGRSFLEDLKQANSENIANAFLGGIIFNLANILLSASIAIAGMSVAFPIGIGIALILGVVINYWGAEQGNPTYIFLGVALIAIAIVFNAIAYRKKMASRDKISPKGILLSVVAGILMSLFYRFIAKGMDLNDFTHPAIGKMTPYTAVLIFSLGIFTSNFIFNTILMRRPIDGKPVGCREYFSGTAKNHVIGILGGIIWGIGNSLNLIAAGKAGPAISYGLGQGATLVAAFWGVFVWKEFKGVGKGTNILLALMFMLFLLGLALVIYAGV